MRLYCTNTRERVDVADKDIKKALLNGLVPSVTTILSIVHQGDHLTKWMIKNSLNKYKETEDFDLALNFRDSTSADFGSTCHALVEAYLIGTKCEEEYTDTHLTTVRPMINWIDDYVEKAIFVESNFANGKLGYGGTADMLLLLKTGEFLLADLKVKKDSYMFPMHPSIEYKYQLSAYRNHFSAELDIPDITIGNFLLVSPFSQSKKAEYGGSKQPRLDPHFYGFGDWTSGFEAARKIWMEKYTN